MGNKNSAVLNHTESNLSSNSKTLLDDIIIIWLDANSDDKSVKHELRQIVNSVRTFSNPNHCEEFLRNDINDKQKIFLIVSDTFSEIFVPSIHDLSPIDSIYVFCQNINQYKFWSNKYSKLKGNIFEERSELCNKLKQDIHQCQNDLIRIDITNDQLNKLEPDFMYSQLLKEALINIEYDQNCKKEFFDYFIQQTNILNTNQMNIIKEFQNDYDKYSPIWWYTRECFIYEMLNKALRTENIHILIKIGFFIRDLHQQIQNLYLSQEHNSIIVYRGQGMTNNKFEKLCQCQGGLISFQNFLSTSLDKQISLKFARRAIEKPGLRGIIFRMEIDPKLINLSSPYASLNKLSYFKNREKEILFSTHTVFRIEHIRQIKDENKIWQVYLKLTTNQDDVQLQQLTKHLRQDLQSSSNPWENLAKLLLTMGQFGEAQHIYENILEKTSLNDNQQLAFIYHQLGCVHNEKKNLDKALEYFQQSLHIKANYLPKKYDDPQLADTYSNIGSIYHVQGKLDDALSYFDYALKTNTNDQRILASIYNNIGMVKKRQGNFLDALEYFEKSLEIDLNSLPPTHPDLATTYSNIGRVYFALKDYFNALIYFQKTLDIRRLSLPHNHPLLLIALANYHNTEILLPKNYLQSDISTSIQSEKQVTQHSNRFTRKISNYAQTIKRKHRF
jgi:tetratricopeptide (TPR) repeat protein